MEGEKWLQKSTALRTANDLRSGPNSLFSYGRNKAAHRDLAKALNELFE